MNSRTAIQKELQELSSSLPYDIEQPVFTVPEGYFESFAATVLARVQAQQPVNFDEELNELSPLLASIPRTTPLTVPENYFSGLTENLQALVGSEELPQLLQQHNRQMPYTVPDGYFDGVAGAVLAKVSRPKGRVISFGTRSWMRIAAAAVVTGLVAISSIVYFKSNNATVDPNAQPAEWVAKKLQGVSNSELEAFLQSTEINTSNKELAQNEKHNAEVRKMLKDVPSNELDAFLEQLPNANDEMMNIN